jgi:hypothetical protein
MRDAWLKETLLKNMCRLLKLEYNLLLLSEGYVSSCGLLVWCCQYLWLHLIKQKGDQWTMNWKGLGKKWLWPNWGTIPTIFWKDWDKQWKTLGGIGDVLAEIWTRALTNTSVACCCYTNLHSEGCLIWVLRTLYFMIWLKFAECGANPSLTFTIWCDSRVQYVRWK